VRGVFLFERLDSPAGCAGVRPVAAERRSSVRPAPEMLRRPTPARGTDRIEIAPARRAVSECAGMRRVFGAAAGGVVVVTAVLQNRQSVPPLRDGVGGLFIRPIAMHVAAPAACLARTFPGAVDRYQRRNCRCARRPHAVPHLEGCRSCGRQVFARPAPASTCFARDGSNGDGPDD